MLYKIANARVLAAVLMFCGLASLALLATPRAQLPSPALGTKFPMYISSLGENIIYKIDSAGNKTELTSGGYLNFLGSFLDWGFEFGVLAVDRAENVYVTSSIDGSGLHGIVKIDPQGNQSIFAQYSLLGRAFALAFDASGNLMVANSLSSEINILRIAPDGTQNVYATMDYYPHGTIRTLAFDDSGLLYGVGYGGDGAGGSTVWKIPPGGPLVAYASGLPFDLVPHSMAFGSWPHSGLNPGTLLVTQVDSGVLSMGLVSVGGSTVTGQFAGAGTPTAFAFGPGSDLYLAMHNEADGPGIYKGDSSGNLTLFSVLPQIPRAIAFTPDAAGYTFSGFGRPVEAPPAVNTGKAGQALPLKWRLTDQAGTVVSSLDAISSITYQTADCAHPDVATSLSITATAKGKSGLKYDNTKGEFTFQWESPKAPGCYKLSLALDTGQVFTAQFKLK